MTMKYYIRDQGNGPYCEGPEDDFSWITYGANSIEVPPRPGADFEWNGSAWARTSQRLRNYYGPMRIQELRRTDIYRRDTSLTPQQIIERDAYYAALINLDFSDPDTFQFPVCPEFMEL